jgi:hypothetical protein
MNCAPYCVYCHQRINTGPSQGWSRPFRAHPDLPAGVWRPPVHGYGMIFCCDRPWCNARAERIPFDAWLTPKIYGPAILAWVREHPPTASDA